MDNLTAVRRITRGAGLVGGLMIVAACTGTGAESSPTGTSSAPSGTELAVTLQEWAVVPAMGSVDGGAVTFNATNAGPDDPHELVVFRTDLGHRDLPTQEDGSVDEEGEGVELIGEIEEFEPGASESATFDLAPGKYVLICNLVEQEDGELESHYQLGMSTELTVE